jgi:GNAT superfamily N-acetyltransferase
MAPSNRQMKLFGAKGWPSDQTLFDETGPNARGMHTLSLIHSRHGEIGSLDFFPHENPVRVHLIHVDEAHRGKGYARAMADEVQRRYPDVPVDHGYKTEMGQGFWDAYSKGKPEDLVQKGRTAAASDWNFEHFHTEGQHWRSFGGPPESPRQHALEYKVRPEGTVEFPQSSMNDFYAKKSGPEAHARMRQNALEHHDTTEHDPASEKPAEPPKQRRVYYHGTTVPDVTHILPAAQHGKGVVFHSDTSPEHAYASTDLKDAWDYAQKAYDHKMNGRPRVYQVRPIGGHKNVEKDPEWDDVTGRHRGNNESDFRSKHGFEVVREMKPPKHVRGNYTDEEWGED